MKGTVLVTGGSGFIAGWAIVELLRRGYSVRTTVRTPARATQVRTGIASQIDPGDRLAFTVADLTEDAGWDDAVAGCDHVLHVASPLGREASRDRDALVEPARGGTLRVLGAATRAGVRRVVMTSAAAAARIRGSDAVSVETMWADPEDPLLDPYRRSKILAERAAWDFVDSAGGTGSGGGTTFATILPGAVFGPLLPGGEAGSVRLVGNLLDGRPPRLPNLGFSVVDVRDLAAAHVAALEAPEAAGQRFLCTGHFLWLPEIAGILRDGLGLDGAKIPGKVLPDWLAKPVSALVPQLRMFRHDIGQRRDADDGKASRILGFATRPARDTLLDCARSLTAKTRLG